MAVEWSQACSKLLQIFLPSTANGFPRKEPASAAVQAALDAAVAHLTPNGVAVEPDIELKGDTLIWGFNVTGGQGKSIMREVIVLGTSW
mgnify:CR=1 FL=1